MRKGGFNTNNKYFKETKNILFEVCVYCLGQCGSVAGSIPGQGTTLQCGFSPQLGCIRKAADQCFSLTLMFFSIPSSVSRRNEKIPSGEDKNIKK